MSGSNGHLNHSKGGGPQPLHAERIAELAALAAGDPERVALETSTAISAADRETLRREWAISDRMREQLAAVRIPENLVLNLRTLPEAASVAETEGAPQNEKHVVGKIAPAPKARRVSTLGWRHVAAVLVLGAIIVGSYYYFQKPERVRIDPAVSQTIVDTALARYKQQASLVPEFTPANPAEAEKLMSARGGYDVPLMILMPDETQGPVAFAGAGTCEFGGVEAIYTRWERAGVRYTMYEFNGTKRGVPPLFHPVTLEYAATEKSKAMQVYVFPGKDGKCCWALVMEGEKPVNVFDKYGYGYN